MAGETNITPLNFNHGITGKGLMDKRAGIQVMFGYVSGLPEEYDEFLLETRGLGMALQDAGMTQGDLDRAMIRLTDDCNALGLKILITKSDMPFDRRWFIIGDVRGMIESASKSRLAFPLSDFLHKDVLENMGL